MAISCTRQCRLSIQRHIWLPIVLVLLYGLVPSVDARFRRYCNIRKNEIVALQLDPSTGEYTVLESTEIDPNNPFGNRQLLLDPGQKERAHSNFRGVSLEMNSPWHDAIVTATTTESSTSTSHRQEQSQQDDNIIFARYCTCSERLKGVYCEVPWGFCGIPSSRSLNQLPGCVNQTKQRSFVRSVWPAVWLSYCLILLYLFTTIPGRHVLDSLISKLYPNWNIVVANRILERNPDRANSMIGRFWRRRRRQLELRYTRIVRQQQQQQNGVNDNNDDDLFRAQVTAMNMSVSESNRQQLPPTELALKTRIYKSKEVDDAFDENESPQKPNGDEFDDCDDDELGENCTICFGPIEDGNRVGALPCNHVFHVNCLKSWLKRRNVCPLCQTQNVATPRHGPSVDETESNTNEVTDSEQEETNGVPAQADTEEGEQVDNAVSQQEDRGRYSRFRLSQMMHRRTPRGQQGQD